MSRSNSKTNIKRKIQHGLAQLPNNVKASFQKGQEFIGLNFTQRQQEQELSTTWEECEKYWNDIQNKYDLQKLREEFVTRAQQRAKRKNEFDRSNTIQNAYFTAGGIYSQLDRLSDCFERADAAGKELKIGVVFTILLELDHDLKRLESKLKKLEEHDKELPVLDCEAQQILKLWYESGKRMDSLTTLESAKLDGLHADLETLSRELEKHKSGWSLPDFPEAQESEELWEALQELATQVNPDILDDNLELQENQARILEQAETVRQLSETKILPKWNRYPEKAEKPNEHMESPVEPSEASGGDSTSSEDCVENIEDES